MTNQKPLTSRRASWALVFACWLVYTIAYIARNTYSASIVTLTGAGGGLTKDTAGLIGTCYFVCYGTGHLINGILADRISPVIMIVTGLLGTTACNLLMPAITPTVWLMIVVWSANGFLQAMLWSPIINLLSRTISPKIRQRALVLISTTVPIGTMLAYLITSVCSFKQASWKLPFFIAAGGAVAACAVFVLISNGTIKNGSSPKQSKRAIRREKYKTTSASPDSRRTYPIPKGRSIVAFLAASGTLIFLAPVIFHGMLKDGIMTWVPSMIKESYGTSESLSTALAMLLPLVNLFGSLISNALFLHVFRKNHASAGSFIMLLAMIPTALILNPGALPLTAGVVCLCALSMLMSGVNYLFSTLLPTEFAVFGRTATVSGIFNSAIYLGSAISTYVFGAVAERFTWNATVILWLALTVASAVVLFFMVRPWRRFLNDLPKES